MPLPPLLQPLRLPVIGSPLFIASTPELVIAQCRAGIVGAFPALNARPADELPRWLQRIEAGLAGQPGAAPHAVNLIAHASNDRLMQDLAVCVAHRVPLVITSLQVPGDVVRAVHAYGGLLLHDVTTVRHAEKALAEGVDGLIAVCSGAGGHAGRLSPFALVAEIRRFFSGPLVLGGAIANGAGILAAQAMGADLAYIGTRWLASHEAATSPAYRAALLDAQAADIVYTNAFTGVHGNYLRHSIEAAGLDPLNLPASDPSRMDYRARAEGQAKAWRDIWGAGQGVGQIDDVAPAAALVQRLVDEYREARRRLAALHPTPEETT